MTFHEQRLDLGINYGATFGPRFNTAILTQSDGQEQRRALWSQPLILAQLGDRRVTQSELNTLLAFHATVKGAAIGFRLRDWSDYKATNQAIGTGNGTVQTWQLVKTYSISTATVTRPITKPVAGSVVVYVDGVEEENGWSVDTTTGVLTTELTGAIAVDFEFDVPVRFEQDKIDFTFEAKGLFTLAPLTCTEIRVEPTIYPTLDTLPGSLEEIIDLGYDFGTLGGPSFSTGIKANGAEFELRKSYWESSLGSWDIGDRLLIRSELDYLIRLFRVCRGMAIPFRFKDWQTNTVQDVRFAEDRISFRFEAYSEAEVIFNLGGMAVTAITAIAPTPPPSNTPNVRVHYISETVNWGTGPGSIVASSPIGQVVLAPGFPSINQPLVLQDNSIDGYSGELAHNVDSRTMCLYYEGALSANNAIAWITDVSKVTITSIEPYP